MEYTSRATYLQLTYIMTAIRIFKMNMETSTKLTTQTFPTIVPLKDQDIPMVYILICGKPLFKKNVGFKSCSRRSASRDTSCWLNKESVAAG
jgi:hypothetical protein